MKRVIRSQSGQAIIEYVLLVAILVSTFVVVVRWFRDDAKFQEKLLAGLNKTVVRTYQSGNPKATSPLAEEGAVHHPRDTSPGNFRIFMNARRVAPGTSP